MAYHYHFLLAVFGLRDLASFNVETQTGKIKLDIFPSFKVQSQAHFAMLKYLLTETDGFIDIHHDQSQAKLTVRVDRSKISTDGKAALGDMLLKLHMYRSTADVRPCREYYEDLSRVEEKHLAWRKIVIRNAEPDWNYVHANTFVENGTVVLKEYEATAEGIIQGWANRKV
ncbi:hypothetical protein PV04_08000 [Phialophora macrospora]|uniref:Uncharacterized protein n=1 Tax=Phialophora macrospora TaxID=1851006 RepID=A0A0D2FCM8_9EURO|nr:hypothetical protein PV04_08000 [Phialophora macrospora]